MTKFTSLFFSLCFLLLSSCNNTPQEKTSSETNATNSGQSKTSTSNQKIGRTNYAIVGKWATTDAELVSNNSPTIAKELADLWKNDIVENAYYDADSPIDKFDYFPNVFFFLKAYSVAEAESILNDLTIVKKGIISYQLYPVGLLWYDRKTEFINKKGMTKSFGAVWTTVDKSKITDDLLQVQSQKITELWDNGTIENVYFDIEGAAQDNAKTDFVFFVNTNTSEEAEAICNALPFYQNKIATYELHQVGVFWMGKYEEN